MQPANGQIAEVSAKPFTDKWGKNITLYSFKLQGQNQWFRTGTNAPPCNQGDNVQFVFEQQGQNAKVDVQSIQPAQGGAPVSQPQGWAQPQAAPVAQAPAPAASRDTYWKDKEAYDKEVTQPRIAYAAAQKSAVALIDIALKADVLGFGNAKKADKLEMLLGYCDEITGRLALNLDSAHLILAELKEARDAEPAVMDAQEEENMYGA